MTQEERVQRLRALAEMPALNPAKLMHIREALYVKLKAPIIDRTVLDDPSTRGDVLENLAVQSDEPYGQFARVLLAWREEARMQTEKDES